MLDVNLGVEAIHLSGYKLKLRFSDKTELAVDFKPFLTTSRNPMIRTYLLPENSRVLGLSHSDLIWDDYDLCFPVADLYEGNI